MISATVKDNDFAVKCDEELLIRNVAKFINRRTVSKALQSSNNKANFQLAGGQV